MIESKINWKADSQIHRQAYAYLAEAGHKIGGRAGGRDHDVGVKAAITRDYKAYLAGRTRTMPMKMAAHMDLRFVAYSNADADMTNNKRAIVNRAAAVAAGLQDRQVALDLLTGNGFIVNEEFKELFDIAVQGEDDADACAVYQAIVDKKLHKCL